MLNILSLSKGTSGYFELKKSDKSKIGVFIVSTITNDRKATNKIYVYTKTQLNSSIPQYTLKTHISMKQKAKTLYNSLNFKLQNTT